ncbi:motility protein A [Sphingomonas cavernae]|uniref:Flagellar motor protein n=1 Tax=Sphingomonas cavernae TaxID=2320861 RepID=A0A418WPS5_9SPHN|nr:MotA/TolQ/ExbB proton channel family protein [Sphingomonas cavernae]RJF93235.1 flagellar motor protein [Sphingomonas cavernae]
MAIFERLALYFDPLAFLLVIGGSLLLAVFRAQKKDIARAFAALGPLLRANPAADSDAAMRAVRAMERIAETRSISCADRVQTAERFLTAAARRLADASSAEEFTRWAAEEIEDRERRHRGAIDFWNAVADSAPGMGMVGTIIGLVGMFAAMNDADRIGPAMALAMLTTLYGIMLSYLVAGPIARRLERLSALECDWQRRALDHLGHLARNELDEPVRGRAPRRARAA